jgi:hypothetical protein
MNEDSEANNVLFGLIKIIFLVFLVQFLDVWFSFCSITVFFSKLYAERTFQVLCSETCMMLTFAFIDNCTVYANKWTMLTFAFRKCSVLGFKTVCSFRFFKILSWHSQDVCSVFSFHKVLKIFRITRLVQGTVRMCACTRLEMQLERDISEAWKRYKCVQ